MAQDETEQARRSRQHLSAHPLNQRWNMVLREDALGKPPVPQILVSSEKG